MPDSLGFLYEEMVHRIWEGRVEDGHSEGVCPCKKCRDDRARVFVEIPQGYRKAPLRVEVKPKAPWKWRNPILYFAFLLTLGILNGPYEGLGNEILVLLLVAAVLFLAAHALLRKMWPIVHGVVQAIVKNPDIRKDIGVHGTTEEARVVLGSAQPKNNPARAIEPEPSQIEEESTWEDPGVKVYQRR